MRSTYLRWLACAALALLPACGDGPTESKEQYTLVTVNDKPLPAAYPDPLMPQGSVNVSAGTLTLKADGTLSGSFTMQCPTPAPPGTTCEITGDGKSSFEGTYNRAEGHVVIAGRQYLAVFGSNRVDITIQLPAYTGYWPTYRLYFKR